MAGKKNPRVPTGYWRVFEFSCPRGSWDPHLFLPKEIPLSFTASSVTVAKHEGPALFCMEAIFRKHPANNVEIFTISNWLRLAGFLVAINSFLTNLTCRGLEPNLQGCLLLRPADDDIHIPPCGPTISTIIPTGLTHKPTPQRMSREKDAIRCFAGTGKLVVPSIRDLSSFSR